MAPNRLEPIDLTVFTGGLNLRRDNFQLSDTESPDMLNVDVDPRGGFYTRKGWQRWNAEDIVDAATTTWKPRNAAVHNLSDGSQNVYTTNAGKLYTAPESAVFTEITGVACNATPHGVDFASWGDAMYMSCGVFNASQRRSSTGVMTVLTGTTWSEVDAPTYNTVPMAEFVETHAGYMFVANISEGSALHPARIRWSHPNRPDAFRSQDYIDIDAGGGKITAVMSFSDHLLIFKTNSLWALFGYDEDSWQLVKVSSNVGCPTVTAVTRSETAVYFFSASNHGGIYGYSGGQPAYMSEKIAPALEAVTAYDTVRVSWANRRLWIGVPWRKGVGSLPDLATMLVFDPSVGEGAWAMYRSDHGAVALVLDGSDVNAKFPLASFWSDECAAMVVLDYIDNAYDDLVMPTVLATDAGAALLTTGAGELIVVTGVGFNSQPFDAYYRTRWLHGGWPDRKKSWRRPTFICRKVPSSVDLLVEQYRDYDETSVRRSVTMKIKGEGGPLWTIEGADDPDDRGFDWTTLGADDARGADWGATRHGATLLRSGPMGHAAALQMRISASVATPLQKWGVDGIVVPIVSRRFRT